jgi:hypothetical protein
MPGSSVIRVPGRIEQRGAGLLDRAELCDSIGDLAAHLTEVPAERCRRAVIAGLDRGILTALPTG